MKVSRVILGVSALVASLGVAVETVGAQPPTTTSGPGCSLPESDAEALVILNYYYPNRYVWEDTQLTVAVQAAPNVSEEHVAAVREAIDAWDEVLRDCFGGQITLTDVTGKTRAGRLTSCCTTCRTRAAWSSPGMPSAAPTAAGTSSFRRSSERRTNEGYTPEYLFYVTLHELGHALGLGHATNLRASTDLMGYGWIGDAPDPLFSQCDLDALAYLFAPLLTGEPPQSPGPSTLQPTYDCGS